MSHRKIILFIVEGSTDEEALSYCTSRFFHSVKNEVVFEVVRGDLTSKKGVSPKNVTETVVSLVKGVLSQKRWMPKDLRAIYQITDTDGVFVSDTMVVEDLEAQDIIYTEDHIRYKNREVVLSRNQRKASNLRILYKKRKITLNKVEIPYRILYMSSCLEHVTANKLNCSIEEKVELAESFLEKFDEDVTGFVNFFRNSDFSVKLDYSDSWDFIQKDCNSLKRHTNFGMLFEDCIDSGEFK